jgi:hypothetical protein
MARSVLTALPRFVGVRLLAWVSENPFRASALAMAASAGGVLVEETREAALVTGTTLRALPAPLLVEVALDLPAYVLAVVAGVAAFVAWR